jgi:DNA-binding GntR family transcriptional regulator
LTDLPRSTPQCATADSGTPVNPNFCPQDDLFHRTIAGGSESPLLLAMFEQLNKVRRAVAWGSDVA